MERFLSHEFGNLGIERVVSVDIEESCLARGIRLLRLKKCSSETKLFRTHLNTSAKIIKQMDRLPVLFEHYLGDILKYDPRLVNTDCVCSTEV